MLLVRTLSRRKRDRSQAAKAGAGKRQLQANHEPTTFADKCGHKVLTEFQRTECADYFGARRVSNIAPTSCLVRAVGAQCPWRFSIATVALLVVIVFLMLAPGFDTNDDAVINMIVAGEGFGLAPDEHMVFTHVWIGLALKAAYTHVPDVPWYASYLLLVQAAANVVLLYCTIASGYTRLRLRLFLLYFATAGLFFIHNLQFTSAAFVAGQSGILLLLLAIARSERGEAGGRISRPLAAALGFLILASLVRREVFFPVLALGLVTVGLYAAFSVRRTANLVRTGAVLAAALVAALVSWRANDAYYDSDPGWRNFYAFNKLRVKFNDEAWVFFSERTAKAFTEVGWSQNDLAMLAAWFYDDEQRYSHANLEKVMAAHPWYLERLDWSMVGESLRQVASDRITLAILLALPIMVYCVERRWLNFALLATALVMACGLILFLVLFQKTPPSRVYAPALAFPLALCAVLGRSRPAFLPPSEKLVSLWMVAARPDGWRKGLSVPLGKLAVGALVAVMLVSIYKGVYPQYRISRDRIKTSAHVYDLLARSGTGR